MDELLGRKRERSETLSNEGNEEFNIEDGLKLLLDVIRNLTPEQKATVKSNGFDSILQLCCSKIPYDVLNWLAKYMDTTSGSIELLNGFSFTITRECVQLIMDLPLGLQPISFCSSPEVVQRVNVEIHGKTCTPSVYELASLIKNGLSGAPFAKAFLLLVNCLLLCPTSQSVPSSSYFNAISDVDRISDFDWCSFVLQWLLVSVNKFQINGHSGNCSGCGLIPVIAYFEFLIVMEVHLGSAIPRLPLWTDNVVKLYAILDSKDPITFGKLPMKHLCSTPFAHTRQKRNICYDLPLDVVSFIESTYSSSEQQCVKKKLKSLSSNLHQTILSNTSRAITSCVDEVLRAFCTKDSSNAIDANLFFKEGSLRCDDLLPDSHVTTSENERKPPAAAEESNISSKDASTCPRELFKDWIYHYMDSSFPPFPEPKIEDSSPSDNLYAVASEVFTSLIKNLTPIELESDIGFINVDDYLAEALVTKLDIINSVEDNEPMSNLDICKLNLAPPHPPPPTFKEEKIDFSGCFDCSQKGISKGSNQDLRANLSKASTYCLSLNERLIGHRSTETPQNSGSEFPEWNFGSDFEDNDLPSTSVFSRDSPSHRPTLSLKEIIDCPTETTPANRMKAIGFQNSVVLDASIDYQPSSTNKLKQDSQGLCFDCSRMKAPQDAFHPKNSSHFLPQRQTPAFQRYAVAASGSSALNKESVQFISGNTCGLPVNERIFRPLSMKHVQSDNLLTLADMWLSEDLSGTSTQNPHAHSNLPSSVFIPSARLIQHPNFHATGSTPVSTSTRATTIFTGKNPSTRTVTCTPAEEELFTLLTSNINDLSFSTRVFQIDERWAAEKTLALCMLNCGYINEYVMDAFVKMILNDQKMNDAHGLKIGFLKHITYSEISEALIYPHLDISLYKKLFSELGVGFRLEHAGLVHVPCTLTRQWFLVVANFMDQCFDVLNPSHNSESLKPSIDAVIHNFKQLFTDSFPRTQNFNIANFRVRYIKVPKQKFKYDSGFFVLVYMLTYNGFVIPDFCNEDLPALKRKLLFQLVANYYNIANKSQRIKDFIARHVSPYW